MRTILNLLIIVFCTHLFNFTAHAETPLPSTVLELRVELDRINFDLRGDEQKNRLKDLVNHSESLAKQNNKDAGFQMMAGFFNAQYGAVNGGLGALKYLKASRKLLEKSIELDPNLYGASAHCVLGTLYLRVPGWPVGFGDKKKAVINYLAALEIDPIGIDSNFTYAQYLYEEEQYDEARIYLEKAKVAPARPNRPKADENVKKVIELALAEIEEKTRK